MSTTVTYKGNTLATVSNNTKTLKTAGKYMEGDVTLTDTTATIVVSETLDVNGGIIKTITTTDEVNLQTKTINPTTSTQTINPDTGYDGFSQVIVGAGSGSINNQNKTVTPTKSQQQITADSGYSGLGTVTVNAIPSQYIVPSGNKEITANGTGIDVTQYATVSVNVSTGGGGDIINNQDKSVTPSESQQTINADSGYTGLGTVTIGAISSTYVGSGITRRSSTDLTISGATVTAPAGYYSAAASKSVSSMTLPTAAASSATSGYSRKATISRSTSTQYINIPTGYNSAGAYYQISAVPNGSVTAPSSISGSSASLTTGTNTLTLTKTVSVTPDVTTEGYISSGTAGDSSVSLTASVTTKAATTYNTSTSNQTIAAGTYLTGAQTIRAVTTSNLSAANIKSGVVVTVGDSADSDRIASVTGTFTSDATATAADIAAGTTAYVSGSKLNGALVIQKYYTGSSAPSSSLGNNGDIYIQA